MSDRTDLRDALAKIVVLERKLQRDKYLEHFLHTFESDAEDPKGERCLSCGLNIRDAVHVRRTIQNDHVPREE